MCGEDRRGRRDAGARKRATVVRDAGVEKLWVTGE